MRLPVPVVFPSADDPRPDPFPSAVSMHAGGHLWRTTWDARAACCRCRHVPPSPARWHLFSTYDFATPGHSVCMSRHVTLDNPHRTSVGVSSLGRLLTILGDINVQTLCVCPFVRSRDPACDGVLYVSFVLHIDHSPPPSGHANLQANAQPHLHSPPYPPLPTPTHTQSGSSSQTLSPPRHRPTIFNR